jgi:nucleotide-binding universal stress UspA family protein
MAEYRSILVATDLSDRSLHALPVARSLAKQLGARVVFLYVAEKSHVVETPIAFEEDRLTALEGGRHSVLLERLRELFPEEPGIQVDYVVREGGAKHEIIKLAKETPCDLIVMSTHGRTGLDRLVMGSITEAVIHSGICPVVTVHEAFGAHGHKPHSSSGGARE